MFKKKKKAPDPNDPIYQSGEKLAEKLVNLEYKIGNWLNESQEKIEPRTRNILLLILFVSILLITFLT